MTRGATAGNLLSPAGDDYDARRQHASGLVAMTSYPCPQCDFILIGEEEPRGVCPECGYEWAESRLTAALLGTAAPDRRRNTTAAASPRAVRRLGNTFLAGILTGLLLAAVGTATLLSSAGWSTHWAGPPAGDASTFVAPQTVVAPTNDGPLPSDGSTGLTGELAAAHAERDAAVAARRRAERAQAQAESRLKSLETVHAETLEMLRAAQAERDEWRRQTESLAAELDAARLVGATSFVRAWQVLGPLPLDAKRELLTPIERNLFRPDLQVEGVKGVATWQPYEGREDRISLERIWNYRDRGQCYLASWVYVPRERRAMLSIGSDDGCCIWLNRLRVLERRVSRSAAPGQDRVAIELLKGWNELLVNVDNAGGGEWALYFEFRSEDGSEPLLVYSQNHPPVERRSAPRRASSPRND